MSHDRVVTAAEMELMSPDERAEMVRSRTIYDLDALAPKFRDRISRRGRELARENGLLVEDQ